MTAPVVALREVGFRRNGRQILDDVTLEVRAGEHWALLGPNGAGKSTILGFCGAVTHPSAGTVEVLGERLGRVELAALRRRIGHVNPRHPLDSPLTVREVALTGITSTIELPMRWEASADEIERADAVLDQLGLAAIAESRWPTLSQGERGRTLIARALLSDPALLLLDEPSTGLDVAAREQLLETVDALERTHPDLASILVTHHLEELPETTTHAVLVAHGRITASGPVGEVVTSEAVSAAFEHPIHVEHRDGRWSARARRRRAVAL
ncbi:ATP-binding cassette domain-containing protein [Schumannella luteola]|uniref:Iron complex transport system ATP-binding protein n=1 Tax=Schumannella luteola TaxID=472059 RepID=A0A852YJ03_9MICO|nr:iron complex transport system ATP-binding protein [Schumannella luteola]TPW90513.1 ATP-binding cassette domain-containing protein [Schumannella luteola]